MTQHLIIIQAGKSRSHMLSHAAFAGSSVWVGHSSNKVRSVLRDTIQMRLDREKKESPSFCAQLT